MASKAKHHKQLVIAATTAWINKDFDALNELLRKDVYKMVEGRITDAATTIQFVTMLLEFIRFLEKQIALEHNEDVTEVHRKVALLVELNKI